MKVTKNEWQEKHGIALQTYHIEAAMTSNETVETEKKFGRFCDLHGKVLDIGCGGYKPIHYANRWETKKYEYWGVDPHQYKTRKFYFKKGTAEDLPFDSEEFNMALFATSLDHCQDTEKAFKEANRILKPGGIICIHQWLEGGTIGYLNLLAKRTIQRLKEGTFWKHAKTFTSSGFVYRSEEVHTFRFRQPNDIRKPLEQTKFRFIEDWQSEKLPPCHYFIKARKVNK